MSPQIKPLSLAEKFKAYVKEKETGESEEKPREGQFLPNLKQQKALTLAFSASDFCFIGAAGTGKTTTFKFLLEQAKKQGKNFDDLGIYFVAPTNKATGNLRRQIAKEHHNRVKTIHKFLEYVPVFYEKLNENGDIYRTRIFEPKRTAFNPILGAKIVVIEESSMVSLDLFKKLQAATPMAKFIFMGDLNQLPTIYGDSILINKLSYLDVVELTEPYRTALDSPIIALAHAIIAGVPLAQAELKAKYEKHTPQGTVKFGFFAKKISADNALTVIGNYFRGLILAGKFQPERDLILIPFNKQFGSIELGKIIDQAFTDLAQKQGLQAEGEVWEVIAGFKKLYLAIGDLVLFEKENYKITGIRNNSGYSGLAPAEPSPHLNRWGQFSASTSSHLKGGDGLDMNIKHYEEVEEKKNQASHIITLKNCADPDAPEVEVSQVGSLLELISAHCITVHKAQGSEAHTVYLILHNSHFKGSVVCRELLYTGVTRARQNLIILCEQDAFQVGIERQRVKGNTLAEKIGNWKAKTSEIGASTNDL